MSSMVLRQAILIVFLAASLAAPGAHAAEVKPPADKPSPEVDAAVERGLTYLARQQKPDGTITDGPNRLATTGLSLLAFLASGHTPDSGKHGLVVRSAVDCLVKAVPADGYIGQVDGSRMYGQGIIALALAEAYGAETSVPRRAAIRTALQRMIDVILKAQSAPKGPPHTGGWRYEPGSNDSDLSLSGWCALSLRAAQNIGMNVAKEPIDRATNYVASCFHKQAGGFSYIPGWEATISMTSVGVLDLYLLSAADREEVQRGAKWLATHPVQPDTKFFYYSIYYSTQAATQVGGELQENTWKNTKKLLLAKQQEDGGFAQSPSGEEPGRVYATAMSTMTLAVPYQLLPIYQR